MITESNREEEGSAEKDGTGRGADPPSNRAADGKPDRSENGASAVGILKSGSRFFVQFGGQGSPYIQEFRRLYKNYPELTDYFECCFEAIQSCLDRPDISSQPFLQEGIALQKWLNKEEVPSQTYLSSCTVSLTATFILQSAYYHLLTIRGLPTAELLDSIAGLTGHSQGIMAAVLAALGLEGGDYFQALRKHVQFMVLGGVRCQRVYPILKLPEKTLELSRQLDGVAPTPMASVRGFRRDELQRLVNAFNGGLENPSTLTLSLVNTHDSFVLSGREEDLVDFRDRWREEFAERAAKWVYLDVSVPWHGPLLANGLDEFQHDLEWIEYDYHGSDLRRPVYSTENGLNMQERDLLGEYLFMLQSSVSMNWPACVRIVFDDRTISHIIDCGPGRISATLTSRILDEHPVPMLALSNRQVLNQILDGGEDV